MVTLAAQGQTCKDLLLRLEKICTMKWLLDLENTDIEITENELQKRINEIANKNFTFLTMINFIFAQCPQDIRENIEKILMAIDDDVLYKNKIEKFKNQFDKNGVFKEFEQFLLSGIAEEAIYGANENELKNEQILKSKFHETKRKYYVLLFNILAEECNNTVKFDTSEIIYNLPLLSLWVGKNKLKPVEKLTNDDCEIIAGLYYGFDYDDFFALNLSSTARNYKVIHRIIQNLPAKFHVNNITQVIFRLFLLKPFLWCQPSHKEIVMAISGIHRVL